MELRECTPADFAEVIHLWERCALTRPWNDPRDDLEKALAAPDATVMLGVQAGRVIASGMVGFDGHRGWVYYLAVDPERRRQGLGRAMMQAAEAWLRARGAPKLQLMVRDTNAAAINFYSRLGLEPQAVVTLGRRLDGR